MSDTTATLWAHDNEAEWWNSTDPDDAVQAIIDQSEAAELKIGDELTIYTAEKIMHDSGDKLSESSKADLQGKIDGLRSDINADRYDAVEQKTNELRQMIEAAGVDMNAQQAEQVGGSAPEGDEPSDQEDDVVDGEFEDA